MADEPDTRSSPGAGQRYDDNPPDCAQLNTIKNNGYERTTGNDDMMERLNTEQGAEGNRTLHPHSRIVRTTTLHIFLERLRTWNQQKRKHIQDIIVIL